MSVIVNGKEMETEEALALMDKESTIINSVKVTITNDNVGKVRELTHEGFAITQDVISEMSETMTRVNASSCKTSFFKSPKIMNRDLYILMVDQNILPWWKRKFIEKFL